MAGTVPLGAARNSKVLRLCFQGFSDELHQSLPLVSRYVKIDLHAITSLLFCMWFLVVYTSLYPAEIASRYCTSAKELSTNNMIGELSKSHNAILHPVLSQDLNT